MILKKLISFFWGSLAGVTVDLVFFQTLASLGLAPAWCNTVSSALAVVTTYLFVTRYTFKDSHSPGNFVLFIFGYACSIAFFSWAIGAAVTATGWPPLVCKILSLPLSFAVNFLFSRFVLRSRHNVR